MRFRIRNTLLRSDLAIAAALIAAAALAALLYIVPTAQSLFIETNPVRINELITNIVTASITALLMVIVLVISWGVYLYLSMRNSANRVKAGVLRIANGDFSQKIVTNTNNEIDQFADYFNSMAERLKESYRRLDHERQRDETLLLSMHEGIIALNEKSKITLINNAAISLLELPNESIALGQQSSEVLRLYSSQTGETRPIAKTQTPDYKSVFEQQTASGVFNLLNRDHKIIQVDVNATPIRLDGKTIGAIVVLRDVTKERTIDRMKTEFLSLASHQLRTPLSALNWYSELLLSNEYGKLNTEQYDFAQNIVGATKRMVQLVNSLLNVSRIESGRIIIDTQPTNLTKLVTSLVRELEIKAAEKKQQISLSIQPNLPITSLDPDLISQVYINLITNSIRYTPTEGKINITINKSGDNIISQVSDNGYGIPKDQQGRIFQKFFRASNAITTDVSGSGLGLYLTRSIVESAGGKIWFESTEGMGTSFWFSIPKTGMRSQKGEVKLSTQGDKI